MLKVICPNPSCGKELQFILPAMGRVAGCNFCGVTFKIEGGPTADNSVACALVANKAR